MTNIVVSSMEQVAARHVFSGICFLLLEKCTLQKCVYFSKMGRFICALFFYDLRQDQGRGEGHFGWEHVLFVSVDRAMGCQMRVNDVFCAVSLTGTMWSAISVLLEKSASGIFLLPIPPRKGPFSMQKYWQTLRI